MEENKLSNHKERFIPLEKREMRGVAVSTVLVFAVPLISLIITAVQLTSKINQNSADIQELEKKLEVLNTKIETHALKHNNHEVWRAVMEEKFKNFVK